MSEHEQQTSGPDTSSSGVPDSGAAPATGAQFEIIRGRARVGVCALAAGLRSFRVDGVPVVTEYADDSIAPGGAGITLAPWPNRVAGGKWRYQGKEMQLDITEPALGNAIHGLLRNTGYTLADLGPFHVSLTATIYPQHGYPFHLEHTVTYRLLEDESLQVTQALRNLGPAGAGTAPVALGAHPYLCLGDTAPEDLTLRFQASGMIENDARNIPVRTVDAGPEIDINVGIDNPDNCYVGVGGDADRHELRLESAEGQQVTLWANAPLDYFQIYVNSSYPGRGRAIAVEPMSAPANAYNSGEGLAWLEPGGTFAVHWGISTDI